MRLGASDLEHDGSLDGTRRRGIVRLARGDSPAQGVGVFIAAGWIDATAARARRVRPPRVQKVRASRQQIRDSALGLLYLNGACRL